jgi:hypothetical protein
MTAQDLWQPLHDELDLWRISGLTPELWLRDDDAIEPTPHLDRLITLIEEFHIPLALAIIPAHTGPALVRRLADATYVHPLVHGWSHANHAPPSEKKQELGIHRPRTAVLSDLAKGRERLSGLYGERLVSILVPPWNRIDPDLLNDLPALGFTGLSAFGHKLHSRPGLTVINTHIDIIDSHAGNACRDHAWLVAALAGELAQARAAGGSPIGVLSHHLVSDERAFRFLEDLFTAAPHGLVRWRALDQLLALHGSSSST